MNRDKFMKELEYNIVHSMKDVKDSLSGIEMTFFTCNEFPCWVKRIKDEYFDCVQDIRVISFDSVKCTDDEIELFTELKSTEDTITTVMKKYITDSLTVSLERDVEWDGMKYLTVDIKLEGKSISKSREYLTNN